MVTISIWGYLGGCVAGGVISWGLGWISCMMWNDIDEPFWTNITEAWRRDP